MGLDGAKDGTEDGAEVASAGPSDASPIKPSAVSKDAAEGPHGAPALRVRSQTRRLHAILRARKRSRGRGSGSPCES